MKKAYVTLSIIIMLLSLLAACVNDTGLQPDTSLPQQSQPTPSPTRWPEAYSSILEEYKTLADTIFRDIDAVLDNEEWQDQNIPIFREEGIFWQPGIWSMPFWEDKDAYGYALKDLNGDGSDELLLLLKDYSVLAVFSTADGKPKLVDNYWNRYYCNAIDKSNLLYIYCFYDSAEDWYYTIERLSDDGSELLLIERYGMETYDYDKGERYMEPHYYKVIDGKTYSEREIISKSEFDEFMEKHPVFTDWEKAAEITKSAGITFIQILD